MMSVGPDAALMVDSRQIDEQERNKQRRSKTCKLVFFFPKSGTDVLKLVARVDFTWSLCTLLRKRASRAQPCLFSRSTSTSPSFPFFLSPSPAHKQAHVSTKYQEIFVHKPADCSRADTFYLYGECFAVWWV